MLQHRRRAAIALSILALTGLSSCGGGDSGPAPRTLAATASRGPSEGRSAATPKAFVPPTPIPANANVVGMWSPVYPWPLISVHSVILPDGRVMTYGSDPSGQQTGHAIYDLWDSTGAPDAGHMTLPNTTGTDLFCSSQLLLPTSGSVFIAGGDVWTGSNTTNQPNNNSNLMDPASNTLARGLNMQRARWYSSTITLPSGETYTQGGGGGADRPEIRGLDGSFRLMSGVDTSAIAAAFPRLFIAPDSRLFGYDQDSGQMYFVNTAGTGSLTVGAKFNTAVTGGWMSSAAMYRPGRILQFGGNANGAYTIDITGATPVVAPTQSMLNTRTWANATILADGKVVATSGTMTPENPNLPTNYVETWDPQTAQWTQGPSAQKVRMYHSNAILLPDASVLVSGGGAGTPTLNTAPAENNLSAEVYYPPYLFAPGGVRAARPAITSAPNYVDIGKTYGVDVSGAASISRVTLVKTGSASHSVNFDQRFLELTYRSSGTHLSLQAPTRAGEAPPGYYMLFVFNESGVPSVARIVRIGIATDPNPATTPVIATPTAQTTNVGDTASLVLSGSDPNGDTLSFSASGLPAGLTLDGVSGRITGVATTGGTYNVVVSVTDGVNSASASFVWTVQSANPLTLVPPPTPAAIAANGTATYTASASGGANLRYQWNFGDGSPTTAWSPSATATHVFTAGGSYSVTVSVTDDSGLVQSRSITQQVYLASTATPPSASTNVLVDRSARVWVVNQDNDSVSAFDAATLAKLGEIAVGAAPRAIAVAPDNTIWVTNKRSATISVIDPGSKSVVRTIALPTGSQPFGLVISRAAGAAYVALEAGGSVLRFDTASGTQTGSVAVGMNVRHLSLSADGSQLYASRFVTPPLPGESTATVTTTASTGGEVLQIATASMAISRTIVLQHGERADTENQGRGIPNYLGPAVISPDGTLAYVPGKQDNIKRGTLRDGAALNFQNTVRAISSRIDLASGSETLAARIDHDNASVASAAVFEPRGVYLFVALETSREVAVINAYSGTQLFRIDVGRAPQGLAVSADGRRVFVNNFMDRTVTALDIGALIDQSLYAVQVLGTLPAIDKERLPANVLQGKQLFYDARDTRLARDRYMSCASCHNDGGQDGRVWDLTSLGEGLRNTIALRGRGGMSQGFLHWSNNFNEVQDFEGQIRALAGGTGLMSDAAFNTGTRSQPLGDAKAGQSPDLDALAAYVGSLTTFDPAPARPGPTTLSANAASGKAVFAALKCASCHSGAAFTGSGESTLVNIGTLKPSSGSRLYGTLTGIDVPTLRDVWATAPYLHDGSAPTLEAAVRAHNGVTVTDADLLKLTGYLREIGGDESAAVAAVGSGTGLTGAYFDNVTLAGNAVLTRTEAVDFDWGTGSPGAGVPVDNYSVRWTGTMTVPSTGTYRFQTSSDEGVRLWIDGNPVINDWASHGTTLDTTAGINLVAGQRVTVQLEYYEGSGTASISLRWLTPGNATYVVVPATALTPSAAPPAAGTGLSAAYFADAILTGTPVLTRTEAVNFDWGTGSPGSGVPVDNFSVRWTGTVIAGAAGLYRFQTVSDDGVRLWIDGAQVINNWTDHGPQTDTSANITLAAGQRVTVRMEYYEHVGGATARLRWKAPGSSSYVAVPAASLYPN